MPFVSEQSLFAIVWLGLFTCSSSGHKVAPSLPPAVPGDRGKPPGATDHAFFFAERVKDGVFVYLSAKGRKNMEIDPARLTFEEMSTWKFAFSTEPETTDWQRFEGRRITVFDGHRLLCEGTLERPRFLGSGTPWGVLKAGYHDDTFENAGVALDNIHEIPEKDLRNSLPIVDFWKRMSIRPAARVTGCKPEGPTKTLWAQVTQDSGLSSANTKTTITPVHLEELYKTQKDHFSELLQILKTSAGDSPEKYVEYQIQRMQNGLDEFTLDQLSELHREGRIVRMVFDGIPHYSTSMFNPLSNTSCEPDSTAQVWKQSPSGWKLLYSKNEFGEHITILGDIDGDGRLEFLRSNVFIIELLRETEKGLEKVVTFHKTTYFQEC